MLIDSCRLTSTRTVLEEMKAGSCVYPDVVQLNSQHLSRLMPKATQIAEHGTAVSRNPHGAGVHKGNRHRTNSTPRKDLGAVVQATAARVHNSKTCAFPVRVTQTGLKYFSQKLAASLLRAATASLHGECTRCISWAVPILSAGVGRRVILEAWFSEAGIGLVGIHAGRARSNCQRSDAHLISWASAGTPYGAQGVKLWISKLLDVNAFQFLRSFVTGPEQRVVV